MPFSIEPGVAIHMDDFGNVDSQITFVEPRGDQNLQILSSQIQPGGNAAYIEQELMHLIIARSNRNLLEVMAEVVGRPYKMQGNHPETGFDVAGLIQYVYNQSMGRGFPSDLEGQLKEVTLIELQNIMPKDVLYWKSGDLVINAGVYVGGSRYLTVDLLAGEVTVKELADTWQPDFVGTIMPRGK